MRHSLSKREPLLLVRLGTTEVSSRHLLLRDASTSLPNSSVNFASES